MSWLLAIQPDSAQADALRAALPAHLSESVVVAEWLDDALWVIDQGVPDVILLPTLMPPAVEDYLIAYLGTIPGAGHVQILGLPRLERTDDSVQTQPRSLFPWRRRQKLRAVGSASCDPGVFTQDVMAYLASAGVLKEEIERWSAETQSRGGPERRREPRFASTEVPWISYVRFGGEPAILINVSSRGALLRTHARPGYRFLRRPEPNLRERPRVTLELGSDNAVDAVGRVVRCSPVGAGARTHYEIAFSFDESVGLHLPAASALVRVRSGARNEGL